MPELRWQLFSKHSVEVSKLPPTQAALKYRIFRCHYVCTVLKKCDTPIQDLRDPQGFGWEAKGNSLVPILTDDLPAPVGLVELSMCGCKGVCDSNRCCCFKNKLTCTDMCKCSEDCCNDGNDEENESEISDISSEDESADEFDN